MCVQQHQSTNLKPQTDFVRSYIRTSRFGLNSLRRIASEVWYIVPSDIKNSLRHIASKVWCIVPSDIKNATNFHVFTNRIRKQEPK